MNSAVNILPHYTYAEWERWEGKWELIDGILMQWGHYPLQDISRLQPAWRQNFIFN